MMGECTRLLLIIKPSYKLSKSWKYGAFSILYTDFLPIPKKEEVVSHPERACATGRTLHVISEREEHSS
jgi:hypothetical protein